MNVGIIGTGAIAWKHAQAYKNIGYQVAACTNATPERGTQVCARHSAPSLCPRLRNCAASADVDFVDVCTFPGYRLRRGGAGGEESESTCWCRSPWRLISKPPRT